MSWKDGGLIEDTWHHFLPYQMTDGRRLDFDHRPQEVGRPAIQGSGQRGTEGQAMIIVTASGNQ